MRKAAFGFAAIGILTVLWFLVPRMAGGLIFYQFRILPDKSPAYYQAAEAALDAWLVEKGFTRVSADASESKYQAPATPPFIVLLKRAQPSGDLTCRFEWSYQALRWFARESEDHPRARDFAAQLKAWREAYALQNP